jgi:RimJ/RimL family protein N-acetyltransferase
MNGEFETERMILRRFRAEDRPANAAIFADPLVRRFSLGTKDRAQSDKVIETALALPEPLRMLAVEYHENHAFIGIIGLVGFKPLLRDAIPCHPELQLIWQLDRSYWGQGLAAEGATTLLEYAWDTLQAAEVTAMTAAVNLPSQRVYAEAGYVPRCCK